MKKLDFLFIDPPKDPAYKALEKEYHSRIKRYVSSELICLKDSFEKNAEVKKKKEAEAVLSRIKTGDLLVICDEHGKSLSTPAFSKKLTEWQVAAQRVVVVIGGAYGMTRDLIKKGRFVLRLSDFTMPHELSRAVLLEQVYRGFTVIRGEKYHH